MTIEYQKNRVKIESEPILALAKGLETLKPNRNEFVLEQSCIALNMFQSPTCWITVCSVTV